MSSSEVAGAPAFGRFEYEIAEARVRETLRVVGDSANRVACSLHRVMHWQRRRHIESSLHAMGDYQLRDIGIHRTDIDCAAFGPVRER